MSIVKATSHSSKSAGKTIDYALNEKKTVDKESGIQYADGFGGCSPQTAKDDFQLNKQYWGKDDGRQCLHYINSFPAGEVTPQQALDATRELVSRTPEFQGFQGVLACHCDGEYTHVHIVADSVNCENGKKFQMSPPGYQQMKETNQQICLEHGYSVVSFEKNPDNIRADDINKYKALERGNSNIERCMSAVRIAGSTSQHRQEFIDKMQEQGWSTNWKDSRQYITFTDSHDSKVKFRDKNLAKTFQEPVGKESLEYAFEENRLRTTSINRAIEQADRATGNQDRGINQTVIGGTDGMRQLQAISHEIGRREREIVEIKQERARIIEKNRRTDHTKTISRNRSQEHER